MLHRESGVVPRNGTKNAFTIDYTIINSKDYHDKFFGLTRKKNVDDALYHKAIEFLSHRNGTSFEDIAMLDSRTGSVIVENKAWDYELRTGLDEEQSDKLIKCGLRFEIIHNHPGNTLPSVDDIEWLFRRPLADASTIVAHDGMIYRVVKLRPYNDITLWLDKALVIIKRANAGMPSDFVERKASRQILSWLEEDGYLEYIVR